jgi:HK97 family phage prohead protease
MPNDLVTRRVPDFKIISGLLKTSRSSDGKMRLHGVASSTTKDLHGDTMLPSALDDMERAANNNLTIFLNHSYNVPEDVAGSVESARIKTRGVDHLGNPNYDLEFDILVNDANDRAKQTFEAIERGVKLGLSIGAAIPDGGAMREKKSGALVISKVDLLETSLVGIPANPRSWVEYAVKNLNGRELPEIDEAESEEPVVLKDGEDDPTTTYVDTDIETYSADPELTEAACTCKEGCDHEDCACTAHKSIEPEITDAQVTVWPSGKVSVTTDEPATTAPQEAESVPDTGAEVQDSAEPTQEPVAPAALKDGVEMVQLLQTIASATSELVAAKTQVEVEKAARTAAEAERDQIVKGSMNVLRDVRRLLDRIADTPLGRKTQFLAAQSEFDARYGGVIDEEVLKMLLR